MNDSRARSASASSCSFAVERAPGRMADVLCLDDSRAAAEARRCLMLHRDRGVHSVLALEAEPTLVVFLFLGLGLQVILHESAHALTTKHVGRDVHATGIGWYLFSVVAFVDTSDMWLQGKRRRIAVAFAGPLHKLRARRSGAREQPGWLIGLGCGPISRSPPTATSSGAGLMLLLLLDNLLRSLRGRVRPV